MKKPTVRRRAIKLEDAVKKYKDTDGSTVDVRVSVPLSGNVDQRKSNNWAVINTCYIDTVLFRMMLRGLKQTDRTGRPVRMPVVLIMVEALLPMVADKTFMKMKSGRKATGEATVVKTLTQMYLTLIGNAKRFKIKIVLVGDIDRVNHFYSMFPGAFTEKHKFDVVKSYAAAKDYFDII